MSNSTMAPTLREKKASRITTACNACRSRKQKCGGQRPVCMQCLEFNRPCAWPEQLKRGPAKGYIEALEHRLHETESILLRVLSQVSDAQLSTVTSRGRSTSRSPNKDGSPYNPFSRLGKRGVDYWKGFPLDTPQNIRKWQQDSLSHRRLGSTDWESGDVDSEIQDDPTSPSQAPTEPHHIHDKTPESEAVPSAEVSRMEGYQPQSEEAGLPLSTEPTPMARNFNVVQHDPRKRSTDWPIPMDTVPAGTPVHLMIDFFGEPRSRIPPSFDPSTSQEPNYWSGAPPVNFQQQFLW